MSEIANAMTSGSEPSPSPEPQTPAPEPTAPAPEAPSSWYGSFESEELRNYTEGKGFKGAEQVVQAYRELEKFRGVPETELVRIPKDADPDQLAEMYKKLGRPEDKTGYELDIADEAARDWYAETALELNLNPTQARQMAEKAEARLTQLNEAQTQAFKEQTDDAVKHLRGEWGRDYDRNVQLAVEMERQTGVSLDDASAVLGPQKAMEMYVELGKLKLGNDYVGPNQPPANAGTSPEIARQELDKLKASPEFQKRLNSMDEQTRMRAVHEMQGLLKKANPGKYK
ncbi:MAG: hypothetical protein MJH10_18100 [Epibacterium sp.]|nr:hypothetical protein [Epibacterium sp.]NQX75404.1 hypothetical protein [Epibacterium sp.]